MIRLTELIIGTVIDNIRVTMAIDKTRHAGLRQSRDSLNFISNLDIKAGILDAIKAIAKNLMLDNISVGNYVCITNKKFKPALNIVGNIKRMGNLLLLIVVTIMKKLDFVPKSGTFRLEIK